MGDITSLVPLELEQKDCDKWDAFADEMRNLPSWNAFWFQIARRFFLYGGAKEFSIDFDELDRVVDYTIALEAALVPEHDFVGRRLRERGARILGSGGLDREVLHLLRDFYGIRSTVAHGSPVTCEQKSVLSLRMPSFEEVVRKLLITCLRRLPADEEARRSELKTVFEVTDGDRADQALGHIRGVSDLSELRRIQTGLQARIGSV